MKELSAGALLACDASSQIFGRRYINMLRRIAPSLAPWKCGNVEPVRCVCRDMATDEIVQGYWEDQFLASCVTSRVSSWFSMSRHFVHCGPFFYGQAKDQLFGELVALFEELARQYPIDFGWIHVLGDSEWNDTLKLDSDRLYAPFDRCVNTYDLAKKGIPNLCWLTIFGGPIASRLLRGAIDGTKSWSVEGKFGVTNFLQLCESPFDAVNDYEKFNRTRQAAKEQIGLDLFCSARRNAETLINYSRRASREEVEF